MAPGELADVEKLAASLEVLRPDGSPRPIEEAPPLRVGVSCRRRVRARRKR